MEAAAALPTTFQSAPPASAVAAPAAKSHFWDGEEFGFTDVLAALNPLQHIPVIGSIYRAITGDTIGNVARVVGDTLYGGGLLGLASSLVNVALVETTGQDMGGNALDLGAEALAMLQGDDDAQPAVPANLAQRQPAPAQMAGQNQVGQNQVGQNQAAQNQVGQMLAGSTASGKKSGPMIPLGSVPGIALPTGTPIPSAGSGAKQTPVQAALAELSKGAGSPSAAPAGMPLTIGAQKPIALPGGPRQPMPINMANRRPGISTAANHAIPLTLSAGALASTAGGPPAAYKIQPFSPSTDAAGVPAPDLAAATAASAAAGVTPAVPADMLERMRTGLDKYNRLPPATPGTVNQME